MNYQTTYLIKRVLSSVASTLVYIAVDNVVKTNYGNKRHVKRTNHQGKRYVTPSDRSYLRDNFK